jgi:hypothetical protein
MRDSTIRRLTVAEVREARDALGARLVQHDTWRPGEKCGCPIGVVAAATAPNEVVAKTKLGFLSLDDATAILGLSEDYADGLSDGFDGYPGRDVSKDFDLGFRDGQMIRSALLPEPQPA